jgi:hypothetical protein
MQSKKKLHTTKTTTTKKCLKNYTLQRTTHYKELHTSKNYTLQRTTHFKELHTSKNYTLQRATHCIKPHTTKNYTKLCTKHPTKIIQNKKPTLDETPTILRFKIIAPYRVSNPVFSDIHLRLLVFVP